MGRCWQLLHRHGCRKRKKCILLFSLFSLPPSPSPSPSLFSRCLFHFFKIFCATSGEDDPKLGSDEKYEVEEGMLKQWKQSSKYTRTTPPVSFPFLSPLLPLLTSPASSPLHHLSSSPPLILRGTSTSR